MCTLLRQVPIDFKGNLETWSSHFSHLECQCLCLGCPACLGTPQGPAARILQTNAQLQSAAAHLPARPGLPLLWEMGLQDSGTKDWCTPGSCPTVLSSDSQPAPASEHQETGSTRTHRGTGAACTLKKFPWVFSRAQVWENTLCRKAQKANTNINCAWKKCMHPGFG